MNYQEARNELDSILRNLDSPQVDIDRLDKMAGRAAELIKYCRQRILQVQARMEKVLVDLEKDERTEEPSEDESDLSEKYNF